MARTWRLPLTRRCDVRTAVARPYHSRCAGVGHPGLSGCPGSRPLIILRLGRPYLRALWLDW